VVLIRSMFQPEQAEVICGMPLIPLIQPNKLIFFFFGRGGGEV
jgi:hypothetical protein